MTQRDRDRLVALKKARKGLISQRQAAEEIGQSERHVRRLLKRLKGKGDAALVHALLGRQSNRKLEEKTKQKALEILRRDVYRGFGPTLAAEYLDSKHAIHAGRGTVRSWMVEGKLWHASRQRIDKIHPWRLRRSRVGELVQWDTSEHAWLEDRGPKLYLISMIDDASSRMQARFVLHDSTEENMRLVWSYVDRHGRPVSYYTDKAALFRTAPKTARHATELPRDEREPLPPTQIGRALRELDIVWIGAHSPQAKVERAIGYVRQNFWPLRSFTDLADVNAQARQWLTEVANQRRHRETGQAPNERFQPESLRQLPAMLPDCRDVTEALVHKDLRLSFDGNRYCVPARYVGHKLTVKGDASAVTIYDQNHEIVCYARSWQRGQTFGAERFEKELHAQMAAAERSATQQRLIALLGPAAHEYLERLADTDRSLSRQVRELFLLVREYGPEAVAAALAKAHAARAFGADYIADILRQQQQRREVQPPLRLKDPALNELATDPLSLAQYDAFILRSRKESRDRTASETQPTQLDLYGPPTGSDDR